MALRLKCGERAALWQNVPNFPFTNEALAASVGLTVDDFNRLPVTRAACEVPLTLTLTPNPNPNPTQGA